MISSGLYGERETSRMRKQSRDSSCKRYQIPDRWMFRITQTACIAQELKQQHVHEQQEILCNLAFAKEKILVFEQTRTESVNIRFVEVLPMRLYWRWLIDKRLNVWKTRAISAKVARCGMLKNPNCKWAARWRLRKKRQLVYKTVPGTVKAT